MRTRRIWQPRHRLRNGCATLGLVGVHGKLVGCLAYTAKLEMSSNGVTSGGAVIEGWEG